jgi:phosphoribosyl 1,2-cyclic phosphodiesterase
MRVHILGSGSEGNAIVLESDHQRILVDAGFGVRELAHRLKAVDVEPESVTALIVTHEHADHVRGAGAAARRWHWPVYATAGTLRAKGKAQGAKRENALPVALSIERPVENQNAKRKARGVNVPGQ